MKKEKYVGQFFSTKEIETSGDFNQRPIFELENEIGTVTRIYTKGLETKLCEVEGWSQINWVYIGEDCDMNDVFSVATEVERKQIMPLLERKEFGDLFMYVPKVEVKSMAASLFPDQPKPLIKLFNLVDKDRHEKIEDRGQFSLRQIFDATDWDDVETDAISDMKVGDVLKFDEGKLIVTRTQ
jgi:hypothetical protein